MYESYIEKIEIVGKLRNLKPGTIRTYQKNVSDFLKFIEKNPEELTCEMPEIILYICRIKETRLQPLTTKMVLLFSFISVFLENFGMIILSLVPLMIMLSQRSFLLLISRNFWRQPQI